MTQLLKWTQSTGRSSNDTSSFLHAMEKFSLGNYFSSPNSAHIGVYKTFFCPPSVNNIRSDESTHRSQKCIRLMQILNQLLTTMGMCFLPKESMYIFMCVCMCVLIYPFLWFTNSKWMWKTFFLFLKVELLLPLPGSGNQAYEWMIHPGSERCTTRYTACSCKCQETNPWGRWSKERVCCGAPHAPDVWARGEPLVFDRSQRCDHFFL